MINQEKKKEYGSMSRLSGLAGSLHRGLAPSLLMFGRKEKPIKS